MEAGQGRAGWGGKHVMGIDFTRIFLFRVGGAKPKVLSLCPFSQAGCAREGVWGLVLRLVGFPQSQAIRT